MNQPPRLETETAVPPDCGGVRPDGRAEPLLERPIEDSASSANHSTRDEPPPADQPRKPMEVTSPPQKIGRYQILRELGRGGFGLVYLAQDTELQRQVAIKVPRLDKRWSDRQLQEYRREAQVLARLDHPHIVRVYDIGQSEQFPVFVVSQCIDGVSLDQLLPELHRQPTFQPRVQLLMSMASALEYAHQFVVHRDIKPSNVLIRKSDSHVFVADFGLALREEEHGTGMDTMGTSGYASPEQ
ncbi:MAG: serine/threonine protein kinase, partial [Planctomycetaceae bacterium]|nr:serine/threonine protein kinase [Planctomycetaceae bacterium]